MEPSGATSGNWLQINSALKPQKEAKSVATGCHQLPETFHSRASAVGCHPLPAVPSLREEVDLLKRQSSEPEGLQDLTRRL
jgi:hypothetical protein